MAFHSPFAFDCCVKIRCSLCLWTQKVNGIENFDAVSFCSKALFFAKRAP